MFRSECDYTKELLLICLFRLNKITKKLAVIFSTSFFINIKFVYIILYFSKRCFILFRLNKLLLGQRHGIVGRLGIDRKRR